LVKFIYCYFTELQGKYFGRADLGDGKGKGIDTIRYRMEIKYADMILNFYENPIVEIELIEKL